MILASVLLCGLSASPAVACLQEPQTRLTIYDVADLIREPLEVEGLQPGEDAESRLLWEKRLEEESLAFKDILVAHMQPPVAGPTQSLQLIGSTSAVLLGNDAQHEWMQAFLEIQRSQPLYLDVEVRFLEADAGMLPPEKERDSGCSILSHEELGLVLRMVEKSDKVQAVSARIMATARRKEELVSIDQMSYVRDWEVHRVQPGNVALLDPIIDVVEEGYRLDLRAVRLGKTTFGLSLNFDRSWVAKPMTTFKTSIPQFPDQTVEITLPQLTRVQVDTRVVMKQDETAIFFAPGYQEERELAILISVKPVTGP